MDARVEVVEDIAVATVGIERQRSISASGRTADGASDPAERDCGYARAIGAFGVGNAVCAIGIDAPNPGDDIAVSRNQFAARKIVFGYGIDVGARGRHIIDNVDDKCA